MECSNCHYVYQEWERKCPRCKSSAIVPGHKPITSKPASSKSPRAIILSLALLLALLGMGYWAYDVYWWPASPAGSDIWTAAQCGDGRRIRTLLREQASLVTKADDYGATALHIAASRGDTRLIRVLITHGANLNQEMIGRSYTPEELDSVKPLHRAEPRFKGKGGRPLDIAYAHNHREIASLLIKHGADPTLSLPDAICSGQLARLRFLIEQGADVARPITLPCPVFKGGEIPGVAIAYNTGDQPIHLAVQTRKTDIVNYLLQCGSAVNAVGANGNTPLHPAVRQGSTSMVEFLLQHGANSDVRNTAGQTPLDIARDMKEQEQWKEANIPSIARFEKGAQCYTSPNDYQRIIDLLSN